MGDIDFYELYGVEPPAEGGEDGGESGAGAESEGVNDEQAGAQATEGGEDAGQGEGGPDEGGEPAAGDEPAGERQPQDKGDKATAKQPGIDDLREQARREAREEARREQDEAVKGLGLVNAYTKQPITTMEELTAYRQRVNEDKRAKLARKAGMTDEQFREFVQSQPEVQEAQRAARRAAAERTQAALAEQVRQIHELDPNINSFDDLGRMPNFKQFYRYAHDNRLSLVDAYRLANMDALNKRNAEAQAQAVRNAEASKGHLVANKPRGGGDPSEGVTVPGVTADLYRELFPELKAADIRRDYAAYLKASKKKGV